MDIESLRDYCLTLNGTTEGMKWDHLCFELSARHGIKQAPHFAKRQWIVMESLDVMPAGELQRRIVESRLLVLSKLSKKVQAKYQ